MEDDKQTGDVWPSSRALHVENPVRDTKKLNDGEAAIVSLTSRQFDENSTNAMDQTEADFLKQQENLNKYRKELEELEKKLTLAYRKELQPKIRKFEHELNSIRGHQRVLEENEIMLKTKINQHRMTTQPVKPATFLPPSRGTQMRASIEPRNSKLGLLGIQKILNDSDSFANSVCEELGAKSTRLSPKKETIFEISEEFYRKSMQDEEELKLRRQRREEKKKDFEIRIANETHPLDASFNPPSMQENEERPTRRSFFENVEKKSSAKIWETEHDSVFSKSGNRLDKESPKGSALPKKIVAEGLREYKKITKLPQIAKKRAPPLDSDLDVDLGGMMSLMKDSRKKSSVQTEIYRLGEGNDRLYKTNKKGSANCKKLTFASKRNVFSFPEFIEDQLRPIPAAYKDRLIKAASTQDDDCDSTDSLIKQGINRAHNFLKEATIKSRRTSQGLLQPDTYSKR